MAGAAAIAVAAGFPRRRLLGCSRVLAIGCSSRRLLFVALARSVFDRRALWRRGGLFMTVLPTATVGMAIGMSVVSIRRLAHGAPGL